MIETRPIVCKVNWDQIQLVLYAGLVSSIAASTSYSSGIGWFIFRENMPGPILEFTKLFAITPFISAFAALVAGYLIDKWHLIWVTTAGLILFVASFAVGSLAATKLVYSVAVIVNGIGLGCLLISPFIAFCKFVVRDYFGRAYFLFALLPTLTPIAIFKVFEKTLIESSLEMSAIYVSVVLLLVLGTFVGLFGKTLRAFDRAPDRQLVERKGQLKILWVHGALFVLSMVLGAGEMMVGGLLIKTIAISQGLGLQENSIIDLAFRVSVLAGLLIGAIAVDFTRRLSTYIFIALAVMSGFIFLAAILQIHWYWFLLVSFAAVGTAIGFNFVPLLKVFTILTPAKYFGILVATYYYSGNLGKGLSQFSGGMLLNKAGLSVTGLGVFTLVFVLIAAGFVWFLAARLNVNVEETKE